MPRSFFQTADCRSIIGNDRVGLPSLRYVRTEVIQFASAILHDEGHQFWNGIEWPMWVTDASGRAAHTLHYSDHERGITLDWE